MPPYLPVALQARLPLDVGGIALGEVLQHAGPCASGQLQVRLVLPALLNRWHSRDRADNFLDCC